jgi:predicted Zn-dependent protease
MVMFVCRQGHKKLVSFLCITALVVLAMFMPVSGHHSAEAKVKTDEFVIIRDAEIEDILRSWSEPLVKAAGLEPNSVDFIIVQSSAMNAFVAGGPHIFLYTGLLVKTENADEVIGVVAHELGHISGGHLVRTRDAFQNAAYESLLGILLGAGAAIVTGEGKLGAAISAGSQSMAERRFLSFSRVQESSADQAALSYMGKAEKSPAGLLSFMRKLESEELLPPSRQSEYIRTHPLTRNRIETLEADMARSAYVSQKPLPSQNDQHARMLAKLAGFISPERVEYEYPAEDRSIPARYARAIAFYRKNDVDKALEEISYLLQIEPNNPFFLELKGQILVEFGRVKEAIPFYKKAVDLYPKSPLIRTAYAHALIEDAGQNGKEALKVAVVQLERAVRDEPRYARTHRLLATAYGRLDNKPMTYLHLAEEALLRGKREQAKDLAEAALETLEEGSKTWLRAKDILYLIEQSQGKN